MTDINIINEIDGSILETVKVKKTPMKFIIYRGRLLQHNIRFNGNYNYTEQPYLELS